MLVHILAIVNNVAIIINLQVSLWCAVPLDMYSRVMKLRNVVDLFIFKNVHTDFHSGYTKLHSHPQWISTSLSPYPHHKWSFAFVLTIILTEVRSDLKAVSVHLPNIKGVKHFPKYSLHFFFGELGLLSSLFHLMTHWCDFCMCTYIFQFFTYYW